MTKVFTQSPIIATAAVVLGVFGSLPAFENHSERAQTAQQKQEQINADDAKIEQLEYDRNYESKLALDRVKGHCIVAFLSETNTPANSIRVGSIARMANPDGVPLEPGLNVCARDGSTAVTVQKRDGIGFGDYAHASRDDHEEYLEYYEKNLNNRDHQES